MTDLTLYYSPGACSLAVHIALEEAGARYEARRLALADGEQRSPEYLGINPKGRVPALADGGFVVTEVPAVLRYVARKFPNAGLWPDDPRDEARCAEWLAWGSSTVHPTYAHTRRPERYARTEEGRADVVATGRVAVRALCETIEAKLGRTEWAAGDRFSVADGYVLVFWHWGRNPHLDYDMPGDFPNWTALARRIAARPAVERVFAAEGLKPV